MSVAAAKAHLRLDNADDDAVVAGMIATARLDAELYLDRALITQTLRYTLSPAQPPSAGFGSLINPIIFVQPLSWWPVTGVPVVLPMAPVQSIATVQQRHPDGSMVTLDPAAAYYADAANEPARVTLRGVGQPYGSDLVITYTAGYGDEPGAVPPVIVHAIKMHLAFLYEHRGDDGDLEKPALVERLLDKVRDVSFA